MNTQSLWPYKYILKQDYYKYNVNHISQLYVVVRKVHPNGSVKAIYKPTLEALVIYRVFGLLIYFNKVHVGIRLTKHTCRAEDTKNA